MKRTAIASMAVPFLLVKQEYKAPSSHEVRYQSRNGLGDAH